VLELLKENGSAIEDTDTEARSKGVPGAQTEATHNVRQATSKENPYNPANIKNV
jgi:hypothetical protein